jgi:hypothetical protein
MSVTTPRAEIHAIAERHGVDYQEADKAILAAIGELGKVPA